MAGNNLALLLGLGLAASAGTWYFVRRNQDVAVPVNEQVLPTPIFTIEELGVVEQTQDSMALGIRMNNPGNIEHGDPWDGRAEDQPHPRFIKFMSPEWGIRAMARIIKNYKTLYGIDTIAGIITRWAPPVGNDGKFENDTGAYISHMVQRVGIGANVPLPDRLLPELIKAIIRHENGVQPYADTTIHLGISWA